MKTKNILALAALGLMGLSACSSNEEDLQWQDSAAIEIAPSIEGMTARVTGTSFDVGDAISLYGWTGQADAVNPADMVVNNATYTYDGALWTPSAPVYWKDKTSVHYFVGVYPQREITNLTADNLTLNGQEDVMVAQNLTELTFATPVALNFNHLLAKVNINLKFTDDFIEIPTVEKMTLTGKHNVSMNYLTGVMTAASDEQSEMTVTQKGAAWEAMVMPNENVQICINLGKYGNYRYTLVAAKLIKGKITTVGLKFGKDGLMMENMELVDWTNEDVDGGTIENEVIDATPTE